MCGIAGIWHFGGDVDVQRTALEIEAMADALSHRGPDGRGQLSWPDAGVFFAHTRLALVDLSETGAQPMVSSCGRYAITFNGEIYNHDALRPLIDRPLRGSSDVEVFVERIVDVGLEAALAESVGMFAFALFDRSERAITLCRDRVGEKPLYYCADANRVTFASELKSFYAIDRHHRIDRGALGEYLRYGYICAPRTILRGVSKVEPGGLVRIGANGRRHEGKYWDLLETALRSASKPRITSMQEASERLEDQLTETLRMQARADVPVGAYLSGGVDSSTLVALLSQNAPSSLKTFTAGFEDPRFNEANEARAIAQALGVEHVEMLVRPREILGLVDELPTIYDEPFADASAIPSICIARLTREHFKAVISADAGDELFAGYNTYRWMQRIWNRAERIPKRARELISTLAPTIPSARVLGIGPLHKAMRLLPLLGAHDGDAFFHRMSWHWSDELRVDAQVPFMREFPLNAADQAQLLGTESYQLRDALTYLPGDILTKVDRASMSTSLESRAPLLDHRIVELAWQLHPVLKNEGEQSKQILRHLRRRYVPANLGVNKKKGFSVPVADWLRQDLRDWATELITPASVEALGLDWKPIARTRDAHLQRGLDYKTPLWTLLMLLAWHRRWKAQLSD